MKSPETILTITGSDGSGGSGIQADTRVITAMGAQAASAITSVTTQNTLGIQEFYDLPAEVVSRQIEAIINDVQPQVVKVGLLRRIEQVEAVAAVLERYRPRHVVYDPVVRSSRGDVLLSADVIEVIGRRLLPLCTLVLSPQADRSHGHAGVVASVVCVFLSRGETPEQAQAHAADYVRQLPQTVENTDRYAQLYARFTEAVEQFYRRYSDVAFYAEQLGVSSRYLAQVTRRAADRSPKQLIDERIATEVTRLLATTSLPLKAVAAEMGFSSQAHLSKFFRKMYAETPTDYLKKFKTNHE